MGVAIIMFAAGLLALLGGAEALVRGASRLALLLGISPLLIGLTIVAFGTSTPELAVSIAAAWNRQPDLVIGNAVGSNIFNALFILGASALIAPLVVHQQLVRIDVPVMIGISILLWVMCLDRVLGRAESAVLLAGIVIYTAAAIRLSRREPQSVEQEYAGAMGAGRTRRSRPWVQIVLILVGLGLCILGARWMVSGAVTIARSVGLSELVIGLTIVACGTSLPEVATSVVAAFRGQRDIAVGNVVGSNIFNILGILGVTGLMSPVPVAVPSAALHLDMPVMIAASVACLPVFFTARTIERWEGALFLGFYAAYVTYLVLASQAHDAAGPFGRAMLWIAVPLALLGIAASVAASLRTPQADRR